VHVSILGRLGGSLYSISLQDAEYAAVDSSPSDRYFANDLHSYQIGYNQRMLEIVKSATFDAWFTRLRDRVTKARIQMRIDRASDGNLGDWKSLGEGISEMRVDIGPGYRIYFLREGLRLIVLLCAGDKSSQMTDIAKAQELAQEWRKSTSPPAKQRKPKS
jgi:putative addiction module killer protein